jgi:hypothetical protein
MEEIDKFNVFDHKFNRRESYLRNDKKILDK